MTPALARILRELRTEDAIFLHTEYPDLPVSRIAAVLGLYDDVVSGILAEYHAGRRAYADSVRLMELSPLRRRVVRVEACGRAQALTTHTGDAASPAAAAGRRAA